MLGTMITIVRLARTDDLAAVVARDELLMRGYNERRIERALATVIAPASTSRMKIEIRINARCRAICPVVQTGAPWSWSRPRRKVRNLDTTAIVKRCAIEAITHNKWVIRTFDGGDVANNYGYATLTEALLVVCSPDGRVSQWHGELPANKVTAAGAAAACLPGARDLFDGRIRAASERARRCIELLKMAHNDNHGV